MTNARFSQLYRWELAHAWRTPLLWCVIAVLFASLVWAAVSTARLHAAQSEAQRRAAQDEREWTQQLQARAQQYLEPAAAPLPYWQDPTHAAGFMQYFLQRTATKPHLPLSTLAVGASDLLPSRLPVKVATPFGIEPTYDFQPPRGLALGAFDVAFVLVYLLPIALILLLSLSCTFERDRGLLRLIAAQPVTPGSWLTARVLALLTWLVPALWIALTVALLISGTPIYAALGELGATLVLMTAYILLWSALAYLILSRWPNASRAVGALTAVWALVVFAVPMLINAATAAMQPTFAAGDYVDVLRRANDQLQVERDAIIQRAFQERVELVSATDRISSIDYATRLSFLIPELERRLGAQQQAWQAQRLREASLSRWASAIIPSLGFEGALTSIAGTDVARHREFERQTRAFQLQLRDLLYPIVQREIVSPTPKPNPDAYGRHSFTRYEIIPTFSFDEVSATERLANGLLPLLVSLLLIATLVTIAQRRLARWPEDL